MAETSLLLLPPSDNAVVVAFQTIAQQLMEQNAPTVQLVFFTSAVVNWDGPLASVASSSEENPYPDHQAPNRILAKQIHLAIQDRFAISVDVVRDWNLEEKAQAGVDRLKIGINNKAPLERQMTVLSVVRSAFAVHLRERSIELAVEPIVRDAYSHRETALARLEELSQRLIESNEEYRRSVDLQLQQDVERNRLVFEQRRTEVTQEAERLKGQVDARQADLDKRERELDDRDNTHVRREHHRKFIEKVTVPNPAALSPETGKKRTPVQYAFYVLIATTFALLGSETYKFVAATAFDPQRLIGLGVAAASFLGISIYYIRWEDAWAAKHASEETRIRRLGLDFDRARESLN